MEGVGGAQGRLVDEDAPELGLAVGEEGADEGLLAVFGLQEIFA